MVTEIHQENEDNINQYLPFLLAFRSSESTLSSSFFFHAAHTILCKTEHFSIFLSF